QRATQALLYALNDGTSRVRVEAVMALGAMGVPANPMTRSTVVRELNRRLSDRDKTVVIWAHVGLMALEAKITDAHLKPITQFLHAKDVTTRCHAARALGVLGGGVPKDQAPLIKAKIPDLLSALRDSETSVVGMSCWALAQIGNKMDLGPEVFSALTDLS